MNITECPSCKKELKETASFCSGCGSQVRCTNCKEIIDGDSNFCEGCGAKVGKQKENHEATNTFEFTETIDGRSMKASFTDPAVKDIAQAITSFVSNKQIVLGTNGKGSNQTTKTIEVSAEDITDAVSLSNEAPSPEDNGLDSIFRETGDRLELIETRLKASGKGDYTARLTYLIVLYYQLRGEKAKKISINSLLDFCGLYDSNFRTWFPKQKADFLVQDGLVELRPAGKQKAQTFLSDVFDNSAIDQWGLGDLKSTGTSKSKATKTTNEDKATVSKGSNKGSSSDDLKVIADLDLSPPKAQGLKEFVSQHRASTNYEKNLVYTYYLKEVLKLSEPISHNHIYSCYRWLDEKFPNAFLQSIIDTKGKKGWLSYSSMTDIKISPKGMNHIKDLRTA